MHLCYNRNVSAPSLLSSLKSRVRVSSLPLKATRPRLTSILSRPDDRTHGLKTKLGILNFISMLIQSNVILTINSHPPSVSFASYRDKKIAYVSLLKIIYITKSKHSNFRIYNISRKRKFGCVYLLLNHAVIAAQICMKFYTEKDYDLD